MSSPKISVIITTYNRPELLPRAIESVLNQTYTNLECIVVDDASETETTAVIEEFDDDRLRYYEHGVNRGLSTARNTGIKHAEGQYIAFLDDDDEWLSRKLEKQVGLFNELDEEYAIIYCWMDYRKNSDGTVVREYRPTHKGYIFPQMLDGQVIGSGSTLLVRRAVAEEIQFDKTLPRGIDGDFIRRVCEEYKVEYVPESLVNYFIEHGNERITQNDEQGIYNHINSHQVKFDKFEKELKQYPARASNLYGDIAFHYGLVGDWKLSLMNYYYAIVIDPYGKNGYKWLLRSIVYLLPEPLSKLSKTIYRYVTQ